MLDDSNKQDICIDLPFLQPHVGCGSFGLMAQQWFHFKKSKVKLKTLTHAWKGLSKHVLPSFSELDLQEITPARFKIILNPIAHKGNFETIRRLCRHVNEIMRMAVSQGVLELNPMHSIVNEYPEPKLSPAATIGADELPDLIRSITKARITRTTQCLILWQLHTVTRPSEAVTARWEDIDIENKVWLIPAERIKLNRPHAVPLTSQTLALLKRIRALSNSDGYLFVNHRDVEKHASVETVNVAIKRMGYAGRLVSQGLRSLAATAIREQGFSESLIDDVLAHVYKSESSSYYNRKLQTERRLKLLEWWSSFIEESERYYYIRADQL